MQATLLTVLLSTLGLTAVPVDDAPSYAVTLAPGKPDSPLAPRFSPKGTQVSLANATLAGLEGHDLRVGRIPLGPRKRVQLVAIARSTPGKPYDLLYVDTNLDGSLADERPSRVEPKEVRQKLWSSFDAVFKVDHSALPLTKRLSDYPVAIWVVVDKATETPDVLRYSRRGYMTGSVRAGDANLDVMLTDMNNNGVFEKEDYWAIRPTTLPKGEKPADWRPVGDFAWSDTQAWKIQLTGVDGTQATIRPFDPGLTRAKDEAQRDLYLEDRLAARAARPVAFRHDVDAALAAAQKAGKVVYLVFETDWCGPCKMMQAYVFTAKDVAAAAEGIVCISVDGDKRTDLTEKYNIRGYPSGILLSANGEVIQRTSGYQGVKQMVESLKKASH